MNRLDKMVVFRQLKRAELETVLDIELGLVQKRVLDTATNKFLFRVTDSGRNFLLQEGTDQRYGARHLNRAITLPRLPPPPLAGGRQTWRAGGREDLHWRDPPGGCRNAGRSRP